MSNVQYQQAISKVARTRNALRRAVSEAAQDRDQDVKIRIDPNSRDALRNAAFAPKAEDPGRRKHRNEDPRNAQQLRASAHGLSLNTRVLSKPFRSTAVPRSRPERLFKEDHHELEPPVATASSVTTMPALAPRAETPISTKYGPGIRYSGTEYLTTISTSTNGAPARGEVLFALPISPSVIPDTRLSLAANTFTRYIFNKCRFYYLPTAPTTTAGSVMMYCDYDPMQNPSDGVGEGALRYAFTHNASEASVWQRQMCEVNDKVYAEMLYCDPDAELRWCMQGTFWVLSTGSIAPDLELGKIVMEYEIDFAIPDYRGEITNPTSGLRTFTSMTINSGASMNFTVSPALPAGTYFIRLENYTTGSPPAVKAFANAEQQGTSGFTFGKGVGCFLIANGSGACAAHFYPDLYQLGSIQATAIVNATGATITSGSLVFNAQVYSLVKVADD